MPRPELCKACALPARRGHCVVGGTCVGVRRAYDEAVYEERARVRAGRDALGDAWVWCGDEHDDLDSMSDDMRVSITGAQLRALHNASVGEGWRRARANLLHRLECDEDENGNDLPTPPRELRPELSKPELRVLVKLCDSRLVGAHSGHEDCLVSDARSTLLSALPFPPAPASKDGAR